MNQEKNRLYRSRKDRMLAGVLGGIADRLGADPSVVRLVYVALTILTGFIPLIILYLVAAIIIPEEPGETPSEPSPPAE